MESKAVCFIHPFAELKRLQFDTTVLAYLSSKFFQKVVYKVYNVFLKTQNMYLKNTWQFQDVLFLIYFVSMIVCSMFYTPIQEIQDFRSLISVICTSYIYISLYFNHR